MVGKFIWSCNKKTNFFWYKSIKQPFSNLLQIKRDPERIRLLISVDVYPTLTISISTVLCFHVYPINALHSSTNQCPPLLNQSATASFNVTFTFSITIFLISSHPSMILDECWTKTFESPTKRDVSDFQSSMKFCTTKNMLKHFIGNRKST